ncbi:O-antigen ligase family protein [Sphingomonas solaris]|uniref:O-antigen ligase family protein n=1 Tax=Alterirhizorhabdus solaris TaxID=2529389 RepID=A0A558R2I9_9SPHN|nr:O-antigen ligase family protein [Sphingomonas solaris]TVV73604.1 hypothetical protein FOY91_12025 [Sphingomonas solaris]
MDELGGEGRSLPIYAELPALLAAAVVLYYLLRRTSSSAGRFVLVAVWLRCALGALHEFSFKSSPLGLSYNALASLIVFGVGLLVVRRRRALDPALIPFYVYALALFTSAATTGLLPDMFKEMTKFLYLMILILAVDDAITDEGADRFLKLLLGAFALPFGMQLISIVLNISKPGEDDNAASFIGGVNHQAAFSLVLVAALLAGCLIRGLGGRAKLALIAYGLVAIMAANYRTAIVAVLPVLGAALVLGITRRFVPTQRALVAGLIAMAVTVAGIAGAVKEQERFADIGVALSQGTDIIKPPHTFTTEERHLMSGRAAIWSGYLYGWYDGSPVQKMFGKGPGTSWTYFVVYAHNTLVGVLFELGLLGLFATLFLWIWMFALALLAKGGPKAELIFGHVSFFLLNMATMPTYLIEGMIFYGVLCGVTVHFYRTSRAAPRRVMQDTNQPQRAITA